MRNHAAIARARAALDAERVVFTGWAGTGKTVLATCLLVAQAERRATEGAFVHAHDLATARGQQPYGQGEAPEVARALRAGILLLDDLGAEDKCFLNAVAPVLGRRHAEMTATIITTGFTADWLAGRYGDGVARRCFEDAVLIDVGGGRPA